MTAIRLERPGDEAAIHEIHRQAFGQDAEARLVDALRAANCMTLSLVAELLGDIVGHILFSPAEVVAVNATAPCVALAPMAVIPARQGHGIGSQLVRHGVDLLRNRRHSLVIVLGHPDFYPRFGFSRASQMGLECPFEVNDDAWMAMQLLPGLVRHYRGRVRYHQAFEAWT